MKKIIIPGVRQDKTKRFECSNCGCVFDADENDYYENDSLITRMYAAYCPTCGYAVWKEEANENGFDELMKGRKDG